METDQTETPLVITVFTAKGGSGKTTIAASLADIYSNEWPRADDGSNSAIGIDLDRQGHLTTALGFERSSGVARWLSPLQDTPVADCIRRSPHGPDVIPSDHVTAGIDAMLQVMRLPVTTLRDKINKDLRNYRFVICDTAAHGYLAEMALAAAHVVVVPVAARMADVDGASTFAMLGNNDILRNARMILVPNRVDWRSSAIARRALEAMRKLSETTGWELGESVRESVDVDRAFDAGIPMPTFRPGSIVAASMSTLSRLVLRDVTDERMTT